MGLPCPATRKISLRFSTIRETFDVERGNTGANARIHEKAGRRRRRRIPRWIESKATVSPVWVLWVAARSFRRKPQRSQETTSFRATFGSSVKTHRWIKVERMGRPTKFILRCLPLPLVTDYGKRSSPRLDNISFLFSLLEKLFDKLFPIRTSTERFTNVDKNRRDTSKSLPSK